MQELALVADRMKLLGDKTRLLMLLLMQEREWCVCEFVDIFEMSQPAISQHLRKLKSLEIVREERRGQWIYYSLFIEDKPYISAVLAQLPSGRSLLRESGKGSMTSDCSPK
ncbi:metalloregulator ArsR/SmtB family transcription factor [Paenibacillus sp. Marseille-Q4541]|uniref:ArsR/SmtB family transcription factor n=1 Tax=Paenibacillus sp. Marseille-Q4541 TaxID=2831522 RepID=UPI001BA9DB73|nr:metalloregulator ArsR/SmtB family transcription factor [Paenibacillus sp. Marseille-Q4541]